MIYNKLEGYFGSLKKEKELWDLVGKETTHESNLHRNQVHTPIIQGNGAVCNDVDVHFAF